MPSFLFFVLNRHLPGNSRVARKLVWLGPSEERGREVRKVTERCEVVGLRKGLVSREDLLPLYEMGS